LLLEVLRGQAVRTQEELAAELAERGVEASQVTLSRDLRELGVVKAPDGYRESAVAASPQEDQLPRALRDFAVSIAAAGSLVVLRTTAGAAGPLALALDRSGLERIVGTIAGDDTIFVATPSNRDATRLTAELEALRG